ncbi:hypothetical protein VOI54_03505 [Tamlana sp. 2201CG12-4]|uniref:hypothetical protein n=1 Tax=Tamlana sp. 2201CG12-4 TaxID=3112582 RepID=UPI002DBC7D73|nr:hypothetical protein [Tamlana sp. 2201CG12-4]MEC3906068.1 hypothetical protein [Tamlana sp. 2201CG12-4]
MKKQILIYILFNIFLLQGVYPNSNKLKTMNYDKNAKNIELQFKVSKTKMIQRIEKIWNCKVLDLKSMILKFNEINKDYIIIEIELEKKNIKEDFEFNLRATSKILNRHILNLKDFKGAQLNYIINTANETKKNSEIIFEIPDKYPVLKECNKNLDNEDMRKCFSKELGKHINKNFNTTILKKMGLKKGMHKIPVYFTIDKTGKIIDIIPDNKNENERVKLEAYRVVKSIKIMTPAYNNGKFINLKLVIPIAFKID